MKKDQRSQGDNEPDGQVLVEFLHNVLLELDGAATTDTGGLNRPVARQEREGRAVCLIALEFPHSRQGATIKQRKGKAGGGREKRNPLQGRHLGGGGGSLLVI